MQSYPHLALNVIKSRIPNFKPKYGIILGSGLGDFVKKIDVLEIVDYADLPGFPTLGVKGHVGRLVLGTINNVPVVCLQGRTHLYEGIENQEYVKTYVRTLYLLGCEELIITNASGSLREDVAPGELMLISDHINFQGQNPLLGPNDDEFGPRFFPLDKAYDLNMRNKFLKIANKNNFNLHEGVYISVLGPNYETAAEIKAFRTLGADAVGMSTVPEVLVAAHCGLKLAVIAAITNFATGIATKSHDHDAVLAKASEISNKLTKLLELFISE